MSKVSKIDGYFRQTHGLNFNPERVKVACVCGLNLSSSCYSIKYLKHSIKFLNTWLSWKSFYEIIIRILLSILIQFLHFEKLKSWKLLPRKSSKNLKLFCFLSLFMRDIKGLVKNLTKSDSSDQGFQNMQPADLMWPAIIQVISFVLIFSCFIFKITSLN